MWYKEWGQVMIARAVCIGTLCLLAALSESRAYAGLDSTTAVGSQDDGPQSTAYITDPLLKEAYTYWADAHNRRRDYAISLFEKYIARYPASPFLPEIYFRIGALYSINANSALGEATNRALATKYFELARKGFGEKYCVENVVAWGSLTNYAGDVGKGKEYYNWLRKLQTQATADDIYPIRSIALCLQGLPAEMSSSEREGLLPGVKKNLQAYVTTTEQNLVYMALPTDLAALASEYPGTRLSELAGQALAEKTRAEARSMAKAGDLAPPADIETSAEPPSTGMAEHQPELASPVPGRPAERLGPLSPR